MIRQFDMRFFPEWRFAMKSIRLFVVVFLFSFFSKNTLANTFETIEKKRVAATLGSVTLCADSAFASAMNVFFEEGELFEIIGETQKEHDDKNQNQKFKWYKIKAKNQKTGWVFGDALAVINNGILPAELLAFHKKNFKFSNGFENALCWIAEINGSESKLASAMMNPIYKETYLVITNDNGNSVLVNLSGESVSSEYRLKSLTIKDLTEDKSNEIIVEKSSFSAGNSLENRDIEIFSFQSGALRKVFEEHQTLTDGDNTPSPSLYKILEMNTKSIRVAYVDFVRCENYKQPLSYDLQTKTQERCLEYVTLTYDWDETKNRFVTLYDESRVPLQAFSKKNYFLKKSPSDTAQVIAKIAAEEELIAIKSFENFTMSLTSADTKIDIWLYVKSSDGSLGYLPAYQVYFGDIEHSVVLHEYFNAPPTNRQDWKSEEVFLYFQEEH
jgi:predicted Fe-Mo cluster-binding NifX family protein